MEETPDTTSSDYDSMQSFWRMTDAIMGGAGSMRAIKSYLPRFPDEPEQRYEFRRRNAKFTNIYRDIVENLAQRPFAKQLTISDENISDEMMQFAKDVDGRGNHLHVFAGEVFFAGINSAIDWIMVDYSKEISDNATREQERKTGARPYWVRYPAQNVLAAYTDMINGAEEFVHVRLHEFVTDRAGFSEQSIERVRVLNREKQDDGTYAPATFEVYQKSEDSGKIKEWISVEGPSPVSIGIIPIVPFITGRRLGNSWRLHPPMRDAAELQIELYQQESGLKHIKELTAFPMLAGNGVQPATGADGIPVAVPVGPHSVLYAPPGDNGSGSWSFIEPGAQSLKFLADDIKETARELRELGRQPLTAQSGNLTVVTTAFAAQKGNAAIQAWALNLKDSLERAFAFTALWLRLDDQVVVNVDTDFDLGFGDDDSFGHVLSIGTGETPLISREAVLHEAKRRNILDRDYDGDADLDKLMSEDGEESGE